MFNSQYMYIVSQNYSFITAPFVTFIAYTRQYFVLQDGDDSHLGFLIKSENIFKNEFFRQNILLKLVIHIVSSQK